MKIELPGLPKRSDMGYERKRNKGERVTMLENTIALNKM